MPFAPHLGWPNWITIVRLLLIWPFVLCLLNVDEPGMWWVRWVAVAVFAAMAGSDVLDGFLARRLCSESSWGKFLDPLADKVLITATVVILCVVGVPRSSDIADGQSLQLPNWVVVAAVGKDLVVSIGFGLLYLATGRACIRPRLAGKSCTVVQLALVFSMLLYPDLPASLERLPVLLWWTATILALVAAVDYIVLGNRFLARQGSAAGD